MERPITAIIHPTRFPERAREKLRQSLRTRRMDHSFHYESEKQAQQWLALHEAFSPARTDAGCGLTYSEAFVEVGRRLGDEKVALISFGCGGGQKDLALAGELRGREVEYFPTDVSLPLALTAHLRFQRERGGGRSQPVAVDFAAAADLAEFLDAIVPGEARRVIAFFGMIPNFEPEEWLPRLAGVAREGDWLALSANLAPGRDYGEGLRRVSPQYDNLPTREWLVSSLTNVGLEAAAGDVEFSIESLEGALGLRRIEARCVFRRRQAIRLDGEEFTYEAGESFRLFFSYRLTPERLRKMLGGHGIEVAGKWISASEEEGVFLCRRRVT